MRPIHKSLGSLRIRWLSPRGLLWAPEKIDFGQDQREQEAEFKGKASSRHFPGLCSPQELEALAAVPWLQHELLGATSQQERGEAPEPSTASAASFLGTVTWSTNI